MSLAALALLADLILGLHPDFPWLPSLVETAIGWVGLVIVFVYSFLIAFALPGVSEIVLAAPLDLDLSHGTELAVIILVGDAGKATGSVFTLHIGHQTKESDYVERAFERSPVDATDWTKHKAVQVAQNWSFAELVAALCAPGFPDTLSIYAFSILEDDYLKFAAIAFVDSCGRLAMIIIGIEATLASL